MIQRPVNDSRSSVLWSVSTRESIKQDAEDEARQKALMEEYYEQTECLEYPPTFDQWLKFRRATIPDREPPDADDNGP